MNIQEIKLAIFLPKTLIGNLTSYVANAKTDEELKVTVVQKSRLGAEGIIGSGYDDSSQYIWVILSVIGQSVLDLATGVISSAIYDKLKEDNTQNKYTVTIQSPNGTIISIESNQSLDFSKLKEFLSESIIRSG